MTIAGRGCTPSPTGSTPRDKSGNHGVVACSALKRAYRDILVGERRDVRIVFLKGDRDLIAQRIAARADHFMPPELLDSQFKALKNRQADERPDRRFHRSRIRAKSSRRSWKNSASRTPSAVDAHSPAR